MEDHSPIMHLDFGGSPDWGHQNTMNHAEIPLLLLILIQVLTIFLPLKVNDNLIAMERVTLLYSKML